MKTKVLLFAHLREIVGSDEIYLDLDQGSVGEDLLNQLIAGHPELENHRSYLKLSMNGQYMKNDAQIQENAEIAVFPPVSGG